MFTLRMNMTSKGESPRERQAHAHAHVTDSPPPASLPPQDATRADDTTYVGITATPIDNPTPPLKRPQAAVPTPDRYNLPVDWDSKSTTSTAFLTLLPATTPPAKHITLFGLNDPENEKRTGRRRKQETN
jgi:hypothetical protein